MAKIVIFIVSFNDLVKEQDLVKLRFALEENGNKQNASNCNRWFKWINWPYLHNCFRFSYLKSEQLLKLEIKKSKAYN